MSQESDQHLDQLLVVKGLVEHRMSPIAFIDTMLTIAGRKGERHARIDQRLGSWVTSLSVEIDVESSEIETLWSRSAPKPFRGFPQP